MCAGGGNEALVGENEVILARDKVDVFGASKAADEGHEIVVAARALDHFA